MDEMKYQQQYVFFVSFSYKQENGNHHNGMFYISATSFNKMVEMLKQIIGENKCSLEMIYETKVQENKVWVECTK